MIGNSPVIVRNNRAIFLTSNTCNMYAKKITVEELLKKQETERQKLAAGAYEAWKFVKEKEDQILTDYGGKYENANEFTQHRIDKAREEYFKEWGSDGKLTALMGERHTKEWNQAAKRQAVIARIKLGQQRNRQHYLER